MSATRQHSRTLRHQRLRRRVDGTSQRPRLVVFRSAAHIYAQIVDDSTDKTITGLSTLSPGLKDQVKGKKGLERAKIVGTAIAKAAIERKITQVVFDRGGFPYLGQVKALAEAAREGGLKF